MAARLGEILDAERVRQGLSVYELAKRSGMYLPSVQAILRNETPNPGIRTVCKLLAALGKPMEWLDREWGCRP